MANPAKVLAQVVAFESYGEGVYWVRFSVPSRFTKYLPGQFLHLALDEYDPTSGYWPESRVFSIASAPRLDHVEIVYSVKGSYTKRMERELMIGREVWLKLPYGHFTIGEETLSAGPVVLVAGGTGISPYIPFLLSPRTNTDQVYLHYGVRRPEHILFRDQLVALSSHPWFRLNVMIEHGSITDLPYETGRLSTQRIATGLGAQVEKAQVFLSGPPGMIHSFRAEFLASGIGSNQIHVDDWE